MEGDFVVNATPEEVLRYCGDLRNVLPALPGVVEVKDATPESGTAVLNAGVSFLKGRIAVRLEQKERTDDAIRFRGHGDGARSVVDIEAGLEVQPLEERTTRVHWFGDVHVRGSLASIGAGLLAPIIKQNVQLFAENLKNGIERGQSHGAA